MKRIHAVALAGVAALALSLGAISTAPTFAAETTKMVGGAAMYPSKNIVQNAVNSKDHTTLIAAVKAAGLVPTLELSGPFTVFAPTNGLLPSSSGHRRYVAQAGEQGQAHQRSHLPRGRRPNDYEGAT